VKWEAARSQQQALNNKHYEERHLLEGIFGDFAALIEDMEPD
jgi:hypothetical protein